MTSQPRRRSTVVSPSSLCLLLTPSPLRFCCTCRSSARTRLESRHTSAAQPTAFFPSHTLDQWLHGSCYSYFPLCASNLTYAPMSLLCSAECAVRVRAVQGGPWPCLWCVSPRHLVLGDQRGRLAASDPDQKPQAGDREAADLKAFRLHKNCKFFAALLFFLSKIYPLAVFHKNTTVGDANKKNALCGALPLTSLSIYAGGVVLVVGICPTLRGSFFQ